jgi:hypothetical protein
MEYPGRTPCCKRTEYLSTFAQNSGLFGALSPISNEALSPQSQPLYNTPTTKPFINEKQKINISFRNTPSRRSGEFSSTSLQEYSGSPTPHRTLGKDLFLGGSNVNSTLKCSASNFSPRPPLRSVLNTYSNNLKSKALQVKQVGRTCLRASRRLARRESTAPYYGFIFEHPTLPTKAFVAASNSKKEPPPSPESDPESDTWPSPLRTKARGSRRSEQRMLDRKKRIQELGSEHHIYQSMCWEVEDGRRCSTGFKGRSDLVLADRVRVKKGSPPEEWIERLQKAGYDFKEVK